MPTVSSTFRQNSLENPSPAIMVGGELLSFATPRIMGIINVTPDSFYPGSRAAFPAGAAEMALRMIGEGADILDIGACSTRPGAEIVTPSQELERLTPSIDAIREVAPEAIISVDTFSAEVARECVARWNVAIINDISGGVLDPEMFDAVAELGVAYVLMHSRGTPENMQSLTGYDDVAAEVLSDLAFRLDRLRQLGVCDVIVDPGFGFAKDLLQNYRLLDSLALFRTLDAPLLAALSRKSMIWRPLGITPEEAADGTIALNMAALIKGADLLRVHDVKAARQTVDLFSLMREAARPTPQILTLSKY